MENKKLYRVNVRLPKHTFIEIERMSYDTNLSHSEIVRKCIETYILSRNNTFSEIGKEDILCTDCGKSIAFDESYSVSTRFGMCKICALKFRRSILKIEISLQEKLVNSKQSLIKRHKNELQDLEKEIDNGK